jgi:hypothetical protein
MRWGRTLVVFTLGMLLCSGAIAAFRVASMVVVPTAASTPGFYGSNWHTDVEIMNVDSVDVDVQIVLLKCCGLGNLLWFEDIKNALGGRENEGFGKVDTRLAGIKPGQTVYLQDVVQYGWGDSVKGTLLVFAYEAGTLTTTTPPGGNPKLILVNSRTYSLGTDASNNPSTFGTQVPGVPWYDYIDPAQRTKGLDHATFTGLTETAQYRTAVGIINISDRLTTLTVGLTLNAADGTLIDSEAVQLLPLAMDQYDNAIISLFGKTLDDNITGATLKVEVVAYATGALNPAPALMAYVTRMDNTTNDPVFIEQAYTKELPWDCVYNGNCATTVTALGLGEVRGAQPHLRPPVPRLVR